MEDTLTEVDDSADAKEVSELKPIDVIDRRFPFYVQPDPRVVFYVSGYGDTSTVKDCQSCGMPLVPASASAVLED